LGSVSITLPWSRYQLGRNLWREKHLEHPLIEIGKKVCLLSSGPRPQERSRRECIQVLQARTTKSAQALQINHSRCGSRGILLSKVENVSRDTRRDSRSRDNGKRNMFSCRTGSLKERLRPQWDEAITSPFRPHLEFHPIRCASTPDHQIRIRLRLGGVVKDAPTRLPEHFREQLNGPGFPT
jgi:hypothetical protein